jgi:hypothetical protein
MSSPSLSPVPPISAESNVAVNDSCNCCIPWRKKPKRQVTEDLSIEVTNVKIKRLSGEIGKKK